MKLRSSFSQIAFVVFVIAIYSPNLLGGWSAPETIQKLDYRVEPSLDGKPQVALRWLLLPWREGCIGYKLKRRQLGEDGKQSQWVDINQPLFQPDFDDAVLNKKGLQGILKEKHTKFTIKNPQTKDILEKYEDKELYLNFLFLAGTDFEWAQALGMGAVDKTVEWNNTYEYAVFKVSLAPDGTQTLEETPTITKKLTVNNCGIPAPGVTDVQMVWGEYSEEFKLHSLYLSFKIENSAVNFEKKEIYPVRLLLSPIDEIFSKEHCSFYQSIPKTIIKRGEKISDIGMIIWCKMLKDQQYKLAFAYDDTFGSIGQTSNPVAVPIFPLKWSVELPKITTMVEGNDALIHLSPTMTFQHLSTYVSGYSVQRMFEGMKKQKVANLAICERTFRDQGVQEVLQSAFSPIAQYEFASIPRLPESPILQELLKLVPTDLYKTKLKTLRIIFENIKMKSETFPKPTDLAAKATRIAGNIEIAISVNNRPKGSVVEAQWFDIGFEDPKGQWNRVTIQPDEDAILKLPGKAYGRIPLRVKFCPGPEHERMAVQEHYAHLASSWSELSFIEIPPPPTEERMTKPKDLKLTEIGPAKTLTWSDSFDPYLEAYTVQLDGSGHKPERVSPLRRTYSFIDTNNQIKAVTIVKINHSGNKTSANPVLTSFGKLLKEQKKWLKKTVKVFYDNDEKQLFASTDYLVHSEQSGWWKIHGAHKSYYADGKLMHTFNAANGIVQGPVVCYNPDGTVYSVHFELDGKFVSKSECEKRLGKLSLGAQELTWASHFDYGHLLGKKSPLANAGSYRYKVQIDKGIPKYIYEYPVEENKRKTIETSWYGPIVDDDGYLRKVSWYLYEAIHGCTYRERKADGRIMDAELGFFGEKMTWREFSKLVPGIKLPERVVERILKQEERQKE